MFKYKELFKGVFGSFLCASYCAGFPWPQNLGNAGSLFLKIN